MSENELVYETTMQEVMMWDKALWRIYRRFKLNPPDVVYEFTTDRQMIELGPYVMLPVHHLDWSKGKQAEIDKANAGNSHVFEAITNTDPLRCYISTTNDGAMNVHILAHAVGGHGHYFTNHTFRLTFPKTVLERFAEHERIINELIRDPEFGIDKVEYYYDAARALQYYLGNYPPPVDEKTEKEMRQSLLDERRIIEQQIISEGSLSSTRKGELEEQLKKLDAQLLRYPVVPAWNINRFLADKEHNPNLEEGAREIFRIVAEEWEYIAPQAATKFGNEGFASFMQEQITNQPELDLPIDYRIDLARSFCMHDRSVLMWYTDPYALGEHLWRYIDEKFSVDEGLITVDVDEVERDGQGRLRETGNVRKVEVMQRNYDRLLEIAAWYDDPMLVGEFMDEELFDRINRKAEDWVRMMMERINEALKRTGWGAQFIFEPIPLNVDRLIEIVENWMEIAQQSEMYTEQLGTPPFPVSMRTLQTMGTVLQITEAFHEDKDKARHQVVLRLPQMWLPQIVIADTGRHTDGIWTFRHYFDPNFGPLLQSEARSTLLLTWRATQRPTRLLTKEYKTDSAGRPIGQPADYEYFTEDGINVKERFVPPPDF